MVAEHLVIDAGESDDKLASPLVNHAVWNGPAVQLQSGEQHLISKSTSSASLW